MSGIENRILSFLSGLQPDPHQYYTTNMKSKINLLFICHDGQLYGSQQSLLLLIQYLPKERYHCYVSIAREGPLADRLANLPHVTLLSHRRIQWVKHDPRYFLQRILDILVLLVSAVPRTLALRKAIRQYQIDIVHTNSSVSLEGGLATWLTSAHHVWHIRELLMTRSTKFHMVLGCAVSRWLIHHCSDLVICISDSVLKQFEGYQSKFPEHYIRIYNALATIDTSIVEQTSNEQPNPAEKEAFCQQQEEKPASPQDDLPFYIGYIGRISEGKGLHHLLSALTELLKAKRAIRLLVAGQFVDDRYQKKITEQITQLEKHSGSSSPVVSLLGYQTNLTDLYTRLDILVVPSLNEPFGRVVIESMANGVPCVGSHAGGIPELIEHGRTGWLYPPNHPAELVKILTQLIDSPEQLNPVRLEARQMVNKRFNIESLSKSVQACYESIIDKKS